MGFMSEAMDDVIGHLLFAIDLLQEEIAHAPDTTTAARKEPTMGATNFYIITHENEHTNKGMQAAYRNAVSEAKFMEGHDPYSGTIATTSGVSPYTTKVYNENSKELHNVAEKALNKAEKWGDALAIPVRETTGNTGWLFVGWAAC